jgi:hypothetical protein
MMKNATIKLLILTLFIFSLLKTASADEIPPQLQDWKDWVQFQQQYQDCPYFYNKNSRSESQHVCAWPQSLNLDITENSAQFRIKWGVIHDSWLPLPGDKKSWPQEVRANNKELIVQRHNNHPRVYLKRGQHIISGRFNWSKRPENLYIPSQIADIVLAVDGKTIDFPEIKAQKLWLGENHSSTKVEANNTEIEVARLLIDGHPMTLYAVVNIYVSGAARNEKLGRITDQQFQITNLEGDITAYVDHDGYLWAQLKPGRWQIDVSFNVLNWPAQITLQTDGKNWPKQEIWAYQDDKNIRITQVKGVDPINPESTNSPWDEVPNFIVNNGDVFEILEQKRGTLNQSAQLSLSRTLWLAFDGDSYRAKDEIKGEKLDSWRLDAIKGYQLLSASNLEENMLITESAAGLHGLEMRTPSVELLVNSEFKTSLLDHISPWMASFDSINSQINLPHGYMVLAATNVDQSNGVWLEKWQLWDIFMVMLLTAFCYKIMGLKTAIVALLALTLGYHEYNMPLLAWANMVLVVALFTSKVMGKLLSFIRVYAVISTMTLLLILLPFLVTQVRVAIHPQLEKEYSHYSFSSTQFKRPARSVKKMESLNQPFEQKYNASNAIILQSPSYNSAEYETEELDSITVTASKIRQTDLINHYQKGAVLQAGKGTPQWFNNTVSLHWDGPISSDQTFHLIYINPLMRSLWRLLLVVLSVYWLLLLAQKLKKSFVYKHKTKATTTLLFLLIVLPNIGAAQNFPSDNLLDELHDRVYQPAKCQGECASINNTNINIIGSKITIELDYHAHDDVLVAVPYSKDMKIQSLWTNNSRDDGRVVYQGIPWIRVNKGINHIKIMAKLANRNSISLLFPLNPGLITAASDDWQIAGIEGNSLSNNTLQLISKIKDINTSEQSENTEIKQFVQVTRSITFDDNWYVVTSIQRVAPKYGVINIAIPLINNEHPIKKLQTDAQGHVIVSLAPSEDSFSWNSRLDRSDEIILTAANNEQYIENWEVLASPQWNIAMQGLPVVATEYAHENMDDYFTHVYKPRPTEKLTINVARPKPIAGDIVSIESVNNVFNVGKRSTKSTTTIHYKATQGGRFQVNIDQQAEINSISYDGVQSNLSNEGGKISVGFLPGKHKVEINWQLNNALGILTKTPFVGLDNSYTNINQKVNLPSSRWLLYGTSQGMGPAFLYWGELLFFTILAFFLARLPYSMLKFWQWLLLGYAFGTVSWFAFGIVTGWLFFIGWKDKYKVSDEGRKAVSLQWFTLLITLVVLLVFIGSVANGLLSYPRMGVIGQGSSTNSLNWFMDSASNQVPSISIISVPMWWYKAIMLLWSIWVSFSLMGWLKFVIKGFDNKLWWKKFKGLIKTDNKPLKKSK